MIEATSDPGRVMGVAAEWLSGFQAQATAAALLDEAFSSGSVST